METTQKNLKSSVRSEIVSDTINHRPNHTFVRAMVFSAQRPNKMDGDKDSNIAYNEANLADAIAKVASDNSMSANDIQHIFPAVLRMLKSKTDWAK